MGNTDIDSQIQDIKRRMPSMDLRELCDVVLHQHRELAAQHQRLIEAERSIERLQRLQQDIKSVDDNAEQVRLAPPATKKKATSADPGPGTTATTRA